MDAVRGGEMTEPRVGLEKTVWVPIMVRLMERSHVLAAHFSEYAHARSVRDGTGATVLKDIVAIGEDAERLLNEEGETRAVELMEAAMEGLPKIGSSPPEEVQPLARRSQANESTEVSWRDVFRELAAGGRYKIIGREKWATLAIGDKAFFWAMSGVIAGIAMIALTIAASLGVGTWERLSRTDRGELLHDGMLLRGFGRMYWGAAQGKERIVFEREGDLVRFECDRLPMYDGKFVPDAPPRAKSDVLLSPPGSVQEPTSKVNPAFSLRCISTPVWVPDNPSR